MSRLNRIAGRIWFLSIVFPGALVLGAVDRAYAQTDASPPVRTTPNDEPAPLRVVEINAAQPVPIDVKVLVPQRGGEPTLKDVIEQTTNEYRPFVRSELQFLRAACGLTIEQCRPLAREARRLLDETARADGAAKFHESKRPVGNPPQASGAELDDPCVRLERGLTKMAEVQLTSEQTTRYREEIARRNVYRKLAGVRNLVARLDRLLLLTTGQRDQISAAVSANWNDAWGAFALLENDEMPKIPDRYVAPFLTQAQRTVWDKLEKTEVGMESNRLKLAAQMIEGVWDFAIELGEADNQRAPAPVPAPAPIPVDAH